MKVLVVGAGMYVTGRQGSGVGTVMAALAQASRRLPIDEVVIVARDPANGAAVDEAAARINGRLGTSLTFRYSVIDGARKLSAQLPLERFGCAIVVVPDHLHYDITADLLEHRIPPLVVKPLVPTAAEARQLIAIGERTQTYAAVEFHKRWDESNLLARRYIAEGCIGKLVYGVVEYSQRIRIPTEIFRGWAAQTNIFQYLGVHYVDLFYFLTGLTPRRVMALGTRGVLVQHGVDTWDSVHATIVWGRPGDADEFATQLTISWIDPDSTSALSDQRIKIIGALVASSAIRRTVASKSSPAPRVSSTSTHTSRITCRTPMDARSSRATAMRASPASSATCRTWPKGAAPWRRSSPFAPHCASR